ncbi:hypothetical protein E8E14_010026 [Neopestalotiopsis sp. 37M]|nr:hypothetical protein E8E14_010026 [Neopestalotiopsis sp. 37M]
MFSNHSFILLTALTGVLVIGFKFFQYIARNYNNPTNKIPGPWYARWSGAVLTYHWLRGTRSDYVNALHDKFGPVVRIAPDYVVFSDLPSVKRIHTVKHDFIKDKWYTELTPGSVSVFTSIDPIHHRERRRLLSAPIADSSLKTMLPKIDARVRQTIGRMAEEMDRRGVADVFKWWFFMTTDVVGELSFGESFRMLDQGKKNQYISDLEVVGKTGSIITTFPLLARLSRAGVPVPLIQTATSSRQRLLQYAEQSIQRYKKQLLADPDGYPRTLFTRFFDRADSEGLPDLEIRNEAMAYIVAGSDTTSNTLTYLVWSVCRNQAIQSALVKELQELPDDFTDLDLRDLKYLNYCINETLRLYPAAPSLLPRLVPPEGETLAGYWLPGGTRVGTQAWTLHRLPEVFPDPMTFNPLRWEQPSQAMKEAFMPFGGGSRVCLGVHLAKIELRLGVARFFRTFPEAKMSEREGMSDEDMDTLQYFLLKPVGARCLVELH